MSRAVRQETSPETFCPFDTRKWASTIYRAVFLPLWEYLSILPSPSHLFSIWHRRNHRHRVNKCSFFPSSFLQHSLNLKLFIVVFIKMKAQYGGKSTLSLLLFCSRQALAYLLILWECTITTTDCVHCGYWIHTLIFQAGITAPSYMNSKQILANSRSVCHLHSGCSVMWKCIRKGNTRQTCEERTTKMSIPIQSAYKNTAQHHRQCTNTAAFSHGWLKCIVHESMLWNPDSGLHWQ